MDEEERAWNEAHDLTATCTRPGCGHAMKNDGREFCSHVCYYRHNKEKDR